MHISHGEIEIHPSFTFLLFLSPLSILPAASSGSVVIAILWKSGGEAARGAAHAVDLNAVIIKALLGVELDFFVYFLRGIILHNARHQVHRARLPQTARRLYRVVVIAVAIAAVAVGVCEGSLCRVGTVRSTLDGWNGDGSWTRRLHCLFFGVVAVADLQVAVALQETAAEDARRGHDVPVSRLLVRREARQQLNVADGAHAFGVAVVGDVHGRPEGDVAWSTAVARLGTGVRRRPRKERGHVQVEAHRVVVDRVWLITHRVLFFVGRREGEGGEGEGGQGGGEREDGQREKERRNEKNITQPQLHPHSSPPYFSCPVN
jgi:hypothetical protein